MALTNTLSGEGICLGSIVVEIVPLASSLEHFADNWQATEARETLPRGEGDSLEAREIP